MTRPYTGNSDGKGQRRPGTEEMQRLIGRHSSGRLWNLGTFVVRPMRGKPSGNPRYLSVHATGRAADISRRKTGGHPGASRSYLLEVIGWMIANADPLGLEMLADYQWTGKDKAGNPVSCRIWKCDRNAWKGQAPGTIYGQGFGDWIHYELSPATANDPALLARADWATFPKYGPAPSPRPYPGVPVQEGATGDDVKAIQGVVGAKADGQFGPRTKAAVIQWQTEHGLAGNGIVGPKTWAAMFPYS